jgi:hypothetical protein
MKSKAESSVADLGHFGVDPDQDPSIFIIDFQDGNKKLIKSFSAFYFLKVFLHHFPKKKSKRNHKTVEIKVFLTIFESISYYIIVHSWIQS